MRKPSDSFVNDTPLQLTMRELQRAGASPLTWAILAGVTVVLGLVGPFDTYAALKAPARLAFWGAIVVATYFTSFGTVCLLEALLFRQRPGAWGYALLGLLSGPPVTLVVWAINLAVFGASVISFPILLVNVCAISAVVSGLIAFVSIKVAPAGADAEPQTAGQPNPPPLLGRLPLHQRGRLLYLSMQDHYVEVITDRGRHLLLMRLSDAIRETEGIDGLQIHRSHWIAKNAVQTSTRRSGRLMLQMSDGAELPVSRNHAEAVKDAGLA